VSLPKNWFSLHPVMTVLAYNFLAETVIDAQYSQDRLISLIKRYMKKDTRN